MNDPNPFNFVTAVASYFGKRMTDFSRAVRSPHGTVVNWQRDNNMPPWRKAQIMGAARSLPKHERAQIKDLLDWGIS